MKQLLWNILFFFCIDYIQFTYEGSSNKYCSSSSSRTTTHSSSSSLTQGSAGSNWYTQRHGINIEQAEQQEIDFENECDSVDQLQKIPCKSNIQQVNPSISNLHDTTKSSICSAAVKSLNGLISGKLVKSDTGKDICGFLGIPYAKPPIDELRFKRPVPVVNWDGIYEAIKIPNTCVQTPKFLPISKNFNDSEDCLYLNIWVPISVIKNKSLDQSTSVMVWIHEGGFAVGSSTIPSEDGAVLSGEQNVIVASMQYRLGPLGFLYFGVEDAPGMVGLLDQNLALQWINANIQQFGGNKDEITLFGESAGSFSISYHLLSPLSRNLFKRGIMMSGASISSLCWRTKSEAIDFSYEVAEFMGCWNSNNQGDLKRNISDVIQCMRNTDKLLINQFRLKSKKFIDVPTSLTVDDYFLPDTPTNLLETSENTRADLIIGTVKNEGSSFLLMDYPKYFSLSANPIISYDTFIVILRDMFRDRPVFEQDAIISHYTNWKNLDDNNENVQRLVAVAGDYSFVCPSVEFANKWSAKGFNVYVYWFTQRRENDVMAKWTGVVHTADIEYIFGGPLTESNRSRSEQDLSRKIQQLFTNFAKTGIPSKNWGTYTSAYPVFLDLNATLISDQTTSNIFGPRAADCRFWNYELPLLRKYHAIGITSADGHKSTSPYCTNI